MLGVQPAKPRGLPRPLAGLPVQLGSPAHSVPGPSPGQPASHSWAHVPRPRHSAGVSAARRQGRAPGAAGGGVTLLQEDAHCTGTSTHSHSAPQLCTPPPSPHSPTLPAGTLSRVGAASPQSPRLRHLDVVPTHAGVNAVAAPLPDSPQTRNPSEGAEVHPVYRQRNRVPKGLPEDREISVDSQGAQSWEPPGDPTAQGPPHTALKVKAAGLCA